MAESLEAQERLRTTSLIEMRASDLEILTTIGLGRFGDIKLARKRTGSGSQPQVFALKVMKKSKEKKQELDAILALERELSYRANGNNTFISSMKFYFETPESICLGYDFYIGGDLFGHLRYDISRSTARLILADIVTGIMQLHAMSIVHRDIKPENVLIDQHGRASITDFDLAVVVHERNNWLTGPKYCGTLGYMAPEVIEEKPHGFAVDWFSLGVLIYDLFGSLAPFQADTNEEIRQRTIHAQPEIPLSWDADGLGDLVARLLRKNPQQRLGGNSRLYHPIMRHMFFKSVNWRTTRARNSVGPLTIDVSSDVDTSYFEMEDIQNELRNRMQQDEVPQINENGAARPYVVGS